MLSHPNYSAPRPTCPDQHTAQHWHRRDDGDCLCAFILGVAHVAVARWRQVQLAVIYGTPTRPSRTVAASGMPLSGPWSWWGLRLC